MVPDQPMATGHVDPLVCPESTERIESECLLRNMTPPGFEIRSMPVQPVGTWSNSHRSSDVQQFYLGPIIP